MIDAMDLVTDIAKAVKRAFNGGISVFKYDDKPADFSGEYVAVNNLPFVYGKPVNDNNIINVNVHAPKNAIKKADRVRLKEMTDVVTFLIPYNVATEDTEPLVINGVWYFTESISEPMEDTDGTYFRNIRVKVIFSNLGR